MISLPGLIHGSKLDVSEGLVSIFFRCAEKRELCQNYFDRYDLDISGTLNSRDELKFLTINVIKACKYEVTLVEVATLLCVQCTERICRRSRSICQHVTRSRQIL